MTEINVEALDETISKSIEFFFNFYKKKEVSKKILVIQ